MTRNYLKIVALLTLIPATGSTADLEYLLPLYQHLHANPELSFQEEKTAVRLISELEKPDSKGTIFTEPCQARASFPPITSEGL